MLRHELSRAFFNRSLLLAFVIGAFSLWYGLSDYNEGRQDSQNISPLLFNAYEAVIWAEQGLISLLVPFLAVIPFADSFVLDRVSGQLRYILTRTTRRKYMVSKLLANSLAGGTAIALPLLLLFVYTHLILPGGLLPVGEARITTHLVGLEPKVSKPVKTYSTGMRQRLAIAQAMMEKPRLLLLDEPTNGLDREGVQAIHELLLSLQTQGITILLASHNKEELETLCQTVVWMDRGQLMNGERN